MILLIAMEDEYLDFFRTRLVSFPLPFFSGCDMKKDQEEEEGYLDRDNSSFHGSYLLFHRSNRPGVVNESAIPAANS
jgi:hypothetical protein